MDIFCNLAQQKGSFWGILRQSDHIKLAFWDEQYLDASLYYFLPQRGVPLFLVPMVGLELLRESRRRRKRAQRPRSPRGVTRTTRGPATRGNTRKETAGGRGIKREATTQTRKGGIRLGKFIPCEKNVDLVVYAPFSLATYYFSYD